MLRRYVGVGRNLRSVVWTIALALGLVTACGGSKNPTTPSTTPGRGTLAVTDLTVSGSRTSTGYGYTVRLTAQNTGNDVANISNTTLTFAASGKTFGSLAMTDAFSSTAVAASSTQASRTIAVTDDIAGHPFAEQVTATVAYSGGAGTENASKSTSVPALPVTPSPSPATTVTLTGSVSEVGGGALGGMNIEMRDGPDAKKFGVSDSSGRYTLAGLQPGAVIVRAWKSGYADTDQRITLTGSSVTLNFSVPKSSAPAPTPSPTPSPSPSPSPAPPPSSCCKVCTTGKACGNSCIEKADTCHITGGCACNGLAGIVAETAPLDYTPVPLPVPAPAVTRKTIAGDR